VSGETVWRRAWAITGDRAACTEVVEAIQEAMASCGIGETPAFAVRLSLEEALANAVRHGHAGDASDEIEVTAEVSAGAVRLSVTDCGPGFDPDLVPDPTREENLTIASGRGLALMRAFMTDVEIPPPGNCIVMEWRADG